MRVLIAHNRYRSEMPSGENVVVDDEIAALRGAGVEVVPYLRSSDEIARMSPRERVTVPFRPIWSRTAAADVARLVDEHRPDVLHLHNPYPLISPGVVRVARARGVPIVQTVHNHRHVCVKGTFFRDGRLCFDCRDAAVPWPAVAHGCYRDSRLQSVPMAVSLVAHRGTWRLVDRFLALTNELAAHLRGFGVPDNRLVVRPNTVADPGPVEPTRGSGFVYVGRLSDEKGIRLLIDAWSRHDDGVLGTLRIVGDGPRRDLVRAVAARRADVHWTGPLSRDDVSATMRDSAIVIVPSTCPEAFPRVVVEAFALGRPVLATSIGGLPGLVPPDVGWLSPVDGAGLADAIGKAHADDDGSHGTAARAWYVARFHPSVVLAQLIDTYATVTR